MRAFYNWAIEEAVEQQKTRILGILQKLFPQEMIKFPLGTFYMELFKLISDAEKTIENADDVRKSATVSQFLRTYRPNFQDSEAHTIDRFKRELQAAVYKSNTKNKTPEQMALMYRQEITKKLPGEPPDIINQLMAQVQQGARIDDVVNAYLSKKNAVSGEDKVVSRDGALEMVEISVWREDGTKEQHLDKKKGAQFCHPLFKGTKWCIRFKEYFDDYTARAPLYLVREGGKPLILGHENSEWLDTEDEPPDFNLMRRLSVFIMNAQIPSLALNTVLYLPKQIQMSEQYIKHGIGIEPSEVRERLFGEQYTLNGEVVEVMQFDHLDAALKSLSRVGNNKIEVDLERIEEMVSQGPSYERLDIEDLVGNLDSPTEDFVLAFINKRFEDEYYFWDNGSRKVPKNWEDMDTEEALKAINDEEIMQALYNASNQAQQESTMNDIYRTLTKELTGEDNGFYFTKDFKLCISADDVNLWINEGFIVSKYRNSKTREASCFESMSFRVELEEFDWSFNSKLYNQYVVQFIKEI